MSSAYGDRGSGADGAVCVCGHDRAAHRHYRPGSDCASCPAADCARYRPNTAVRRFLRRVVGR